MSDNAIDYPQRSLASNIELHFQTNSMQYQDAISTFNYDTHSKTCDKRLNSD